VGVGVGISWAGSGRAQRMVQRVFCDHKMHTA
jgi:hypothetical protein